MDQACRALVEAVLEADVRLFWGLAATRLTPPESLPAGICLSAIKDVLYRTSARILSEDHADAAWVGGMYPVCDAAWVGGMCPESDRALRPWEQDDVYRLLQYLQQREYCRDVIKLGAGSASRARAVLAVACVLRRCVLLPLRPEAGILAEGIRAALLAFADAYLAMWLMVRACSPTFGPGYRLTTSDNYFHPGGNHLRHPPGPDHFCRRQEIRLHGVPAPCLGLCCCPGVVWAPNGSSVVQEHVCVFLPADVRDAAAHG